MSTPTPEQYERAREIAKRIAVPLCAELDDKDDAYYHDWRTRAESLVAKALAEESAGLREERDAWEAGARELLRLRAAPEGEPVAWRYWYPGKGDKGRAVTMRKETLTRALQRGAECEPLYASPQAGGDQVSGQGSSASVESGDPSRDGWAVARAARKAAINAICHDGEASCACCLRVTEAVYDAVAANHDAPNPPTDGETPRPSISGGDEATDAD